MEQKILELLTRLVEAVEHIAYEGEVGDVDAEPRPGQSLSDAE